MQVGRYFSRVKSMKIEIASLNDIPDLCRLLDSLFAQEAEFAPDRKKQETGLRTIINNNNIGDILVAREDNRIIGMANLLYTVSTAIGGRVALLEDMVVAENRRSQGIGSILLAHAVRHAKEKQCLRITLLTDGDNHPAHQFYKNNGFQQSSMLIFRTLLLHSS